jgi:hypothetical protein
MEEGWTVSERIGVSGTFRHERPNSSMHVAALQAGDGLGLPVDIHFPTWYIRQQRSGLGAEAVTMRSS